MSEMIPALNSVIFILHGKKLLDEIFATQLNLSEPFIHKFLILHSDLENTYKNTTLIVSFN